MQTAQKEHEYHKHSLPQGIHTTYLLAETDSRASIEWKKNEWIAREISIDTFAQETVRIEDVRIAKVCRIMIVEPGHRHKPRVRNFG